MKAGAIGRLDDVTKSLQTAKRQSRFCQRGAFPFFPLSPHGREIITPGKFLNSTACIAITIGKIQHRQKKSDVSTSQWNTIGLSCICLKPSTPARVKALAVALLTSLVVVVVRVHE